MKNFAKVTLISFNTTTVYLHDVMVSENDVCSRHKSLLHLKRSIAKQKQCSTIKKNGFASTEKTGKY